MPDFSYENKYWNEGLIVAGIDEAGRGPLAGPVVASSVIFDKNIEINHLINDSKKINQSNRDLLFEWIIGNAKFGVGIVEVEEIEKINILNSTFQAMKISVDQLLIKPDVLLIDGNRFKDIGIKFETIIKGDSISYSISAASIIAKVIRDRIMDEYHEKYPNYGFNKNRGYATKSHFDAIEKYGICPIHRLSFLKKFANRQNSMFD